MDVCASVSPGIWNKNKSSIYHLDFVWGEMKNIGKELNSVLHVDGPHQIGFLHPIPIVVIYWKFAMWQAPC